MRGRTALVTGSAGGIGLALAEGLAAAGCGVVLHGLEAAEAVADTVARLRDRHGVAVSYVSADLADPAAIEAMVDGILADRGAIDVLVNNAVTRHFAPIEAMPVAAWDRSLAVNVSAAFHLIRRTLPGMRQAGWGRIVNMTSVYGLRGAVNRIDYVTTKSALIGMTRAVALETMNQGITCNALCPGSVATASIEQRVQALMRDEALAREEATRRFLDGKQPSGRFVEAAHVADLLVFLCGPAGRDITGATLPIESGWLAS